MKPIVHPSCYFYEHTDEQFRPIHEEYQNLFAEESSLSIASPVYGDFEEVFKPPLYDEYEYICSEYEGPKQDSYSLRT